MKTVKFLILIIMSLSIFSCGPRNKKIAREQDAISQEDFIYQAEQFADLRILRYQVPGFEELSLNQKELLYYLYEAALAGRDIYWNQNYKHNLLIRKTLETIVNTYEGDLDNEDFKKFMTYTKRVWFSNGIHHHYSTDKIMPGFSYEYFEQLVKDSPKEEFPLQEGENVEALIAKLKPIIFDPDTDAKKINLDPKKDLLLASATNFYEGVSLKEAENFYAKLAKKDDPAPVSYGLNSQLVKENGNITEKVWKVDGMYSPAIEKIVYWLEKAVAVSESEPQKQALELLIKYYKTGDLKTFDAYSIAWLKDTESMVDVVNGFIEVYDDPIGKRGAYQSVVSIRDIEATERAKTISGQAQWFEDNSPIPDAYKKKKVTGVSAKVINVVAEAGDNSPSTPIGVNLPNADWIRTQYGSKSVTLANIFASYNESSKNNGALEEFAYSDEEVKLSKEYGNLAGNLHTDLHEVIGHGSGKLKPGVADPSETLKNYASTLEEARADLVALYYIMDPKMVEIGVMPNIDVAKAEYNRYIRGGLLVQLSRIELGKNIEQAHMRCRYLITNWAYEKGKAENVIERKVKDGKTYFVINDHNKLRLIFGEMLKEIQRIKSEGDYKAGSTLVETYGVKPDPELHKEVKNRWKKLNIAPYAGFINPVLVPVIEDGKLIDVEIEYPEDFSEQMLYYGKNYSFLPIKN